jgi:hypothetical protein
MSPTLFRFLFSDDYEKAVQPSPEGKIPTSIRCASAVPCTAAMWRSLAQHSSVCKKTRAGVLDELAALPKHPENTTFYSIDK